VALYAGTQITNEDAHELGSRTGKNAGRNTLRNLTDFDAPPLPSPSPSPYTLKRIPQGRIAREFSAYISKGWRHTLNSGDRAAWATASANPITLNDGTVKTLTAYQLFWWWHQTTYTNFMEVGGDTFFNPAFLYTLPPVPAPVTTPSAFAYIGHSGGGYSFNIDMTADPGFSFPQFAALVPTYNPKAKTTRSEKWIRCNNGGAEIFGMPGRYSLTIFPGGAVPALANFASQTLVIRITDDNYAPNISAPAYFTLPAVL